jgi:hypothetical protein
MSIKTQHGVAVGHTTPVALTAARTRDSASGSRFTLVNTGAKTVFIGPSDVSSSTGFAVAAAGTFNDLLDQGEEVYAICGGTDTSTVDVWEGGV